MSKADNKQKVGINPATATKRARHSLLQDQKIVKCLALLLAKFGLTPFLEATFTHKVIRCYFIVDNPLKFRIFICFVFVQKGNPIYNASFTAIFITISTRTFNSIMILYACKLNLPNFKVKFYFFNCLVYKVYKSFNCI